MVPKTNMSFGPQISRRHVGHACSEAIIGNQLICRKELVTNNLLGDFESEKLSFIKISKTQRDGVNLIERKFLNMSST